MRLLQPNLKTLLIIGHSSLGNSCTNHIYISKIIYWTLDWYIIICTRKKIVRNTNKTLN